MAILSEIFISSDLDAKDYLKRSESFTSLKLNNLTILELSTLWAILNSTEWDVSSLDMFEEIYMENQGMMLIYKIPSNYTNDYSMIKETDINIIAQQRSDTPELDISIDQTKEILLHLVEISRNAKGKGLELYIYNCV